MTAVLCAEKQLGLYDRRERERDDMHVRTQLGASTSFLIMLQRTLGALQTHCSPPLCSSQLHGKEIALSKISLGKTSVLALGIYP